jgi:RNA polymerase sigma factor (sigma-70 family)
MTESPGRAVERVYAAEMVDASTEGSAPGDHVDSSAWDRGMIARLMAGDDRALAAIYDQYSSLVHGIAVRLLNPAAAADVTQQVFVQLWERPDSFDGSRGSLRTFLSVLTRRRAIDLMRVESRAERRKEVAARQAVAVVPNVDEAAMTMIASERVRAALDHLPDDQRRAVELAYFEGLTFKQVAVATGVAEGTAKSRLRLALARLATVLRAEGTVEWA